MIVRRITIAAISMLALLLVMPGGASAAHGRRVAPARCAPSPRVLFADGQAQIYVAGEGSLGNLSIRGCVYGQRRSFIVSGCGNEETGVDCAGGSHVTLSGTVVAYEEGLIAAGNEVESGVEEWIVTVRDLRTGRVLHKVPTGMPKFPRPRHVGAGFTTAIVVKTDGSVGWINEKPVEAGTEYEVHAFDKTGNRVLASGTNIDPHSLALAGSTLYWTQGGKSASASLN